MNPNTQTELRKFIAPEFVFGEGAIHLAGRYAMNFSAQKVLIVTDPGIEQAGWVRHVEMSLKDVGIPYSIFKDVTPNPKDHEVMAGAEVYVNGNCDMIIAVGGGSPMDCAKGIGIVSSNNQHVCEFEGVDEVPIPGPPLICIPTTAGTSADVSQFAIISDISRKVKIAIISKTVVPDVALIDPATTTTMDSELTAATGMDALVHAFEAYVSNANSPITDLTALEAIRLISQNLLNAIHHSDTMIFRTNMMLGSLMAGLAFSNASLGLVHSMAHSLGGLLDLAHGQCNAILLEHVVDFNFETASKRYINIGEAMKLEFRGMTVNEKKSTLLEALSTFRKTVGITQTLKELGVTQDDIPALAKHALQDPCVVTNPIMPTLQEIEVCYENAL